MKRTLRKDSNCIGVGCHIGDMLKEMIKVAPVRCIMPSNPFLISTIGACVAPSGDRFR
jgi:hypothetical protein